MKRTKQKTEDPDWAISVRTHRSDPNCEIVNSTMMQKISLCSIVAKINIKIKIVFVFIQ